MTNTTSTITLNNKLNGIEIRFGEKPTAGIIEALKSNGYRWSGKQKMWYAKQSPENLAFAETLGVIGKFNDNTVKEAEEIYDLWELTRTDSIENNYEKYHIHSCKEIAAIIRKHIRERFNFCRWSITSDYHKISVKLLASPFDKNSDEIKAITNYVYYFAQSYNYDNSDLMTDYFDVNFYGVYRNDIISYKYEQTEITEEIKQIAGKFQEKKAAFEKAEAERAEKELAEKLKQMEIERKESERIKAERKIQHDRIEGNITVKEANYFVMSVITANINKLNSVEKIEQYIPEGSYRENCKIAREIHMTAEIYDLFKNHLLDDFSFLAGMGGTATDDLRIQSMTDYQIMSEDERNTVEWFCIKCVTIYCDGKLKLVINPEGYSYARYTYIVDDESCIQDSYSGKSGISKEEYQANLKAAEIIEDVSTEIIINNDIKDTYMTENFSLYSGLMKEWIYSHKDKFNIGVIQATENSNLKSALYKIYKDVTSITEQFKHADLMPEQRLTLIYISDFGGLVRQQITFNNVEYGKYAQYDKAVKLICKPKNKRALCYKWFYRDMLVYDGWLEIPNNILYEENISVTGCIIQKSRFTSCDTKQYDAVMDYFKSKGIKPIINTYKPEF